MGVGKSTVGQILAATLEFDFLDTDRSIEAKTGRRISDIFEHEGESAFRDMETQLISELETSSGRVISTGGGCIVRSENLASLRRHSLIVCLWASPSTIYERVRHQTHRPLLQTSDSLAKIKELLELRRPSYQEADILVGVDFRGASDTARHVAGSFRRLQTSLSPTAPPRVAPLTVTIPS